MNSINNQVTKNNTSGFYISLHSPRFPFCSVLFQNVNHFHKSIILIKVTSINSIIEMYHFQKNVLFDAQLLNNLICDDERATTKYDLLESS